MKEEEDTKCKLNERETNGTETNVGMLKKENVEPPLVWSVSCMLHVIYAASLGHAQQSQPD